MKIFFATAAVLVSAKAAEQGQGYGPYYNYAPYTDDYINNPYAGKYSNYGGNYKNDKYGRVREEYKGFYLPKEYIPEQIVPSCPKYCARADMKDAWEGKVGDGRFGVNGEVTFEQNCNGKTTIRATFHDLKVSRPIVPFVQS